MDYCNSFRLNCIELLCTKRCLPPWINRCQRHRVLSRWPKP
ncbi:Uncharacterised protein [Vibrio cholerae]|nr:Uncharacterised protein [Vibrio cholerae]CSI74885.1 Uncharacterised protein [Vibrio cholerae]